MVRAVRTRDDASAADAIGSGAGPANVASKIAGAARILLDPGQSRCPSLG